jgi:hypothetical protein
MDDEKKPLITMMDKVNFDIAIKKVMKTRKVIDENTVTFETVEHTTGDKKYILKAVHVPIDHVFKYASSNCKMCTFGKGYYVMNVEKHKIPDPENYVMLSSMPVQDMSDEQQKILIEKEKQNKFWRIMYPCKCAVQRALEKEPDLLTNPLGNILLRVDYEIVEV